MTPATFRLIQASPERIWQLGTLFRSAAALTQWGGEGFRFPLQKGQFLQQLQLPDTEAFVLVNEDDQTVAFGQICDRFNKMHLARLLVLPQFRRRGYSTNLVAALLQVGLQRWPQREASLFVFRTNSTALACYHRLGFQPAPQPATARDDLYFMTLANQACKTLVTSLPLWKVPGDTACQYG